MSLSSAQYFEQFAPLLHTKIIKFFVKNLKSMPIYEQLSDNDRITLNHALRALEERFNLIERNAEAVKAAEDQQAYLVLLMDTMQSSLRFRAWWLNILLNGVSMMKLWMKKPVQRVRQKAIT